MDFRAACWVAILLLVCASASDASGTGLRVAVLALNQDEQQSQDVGAAHRDWSGGLADYLQIELARRGVQIIERQRVQSLFDERSLVRAGLVHSALDLRQRLPGVDVFISGRVTALGNSRFRISLDLVRSDATLLAVCTAEGLHPDDWTRAVMQLADEAAAKVHTRRPASPPPLPGFTQVPEAAILFYRGHEHLAAGRVNHAVACLHEAIMRDSQFLMAQAWLVRALQRAKMPEYAEHARQMLLEKPRGAAMFALDAANVAGRRTGQWVLMVQDSPSEPGNAKALRHALSLEPNIQVRDLDWLGNSLREHDLHLSGELEPTAVPGRGWLAADAIVLPATSEAGTQRWDLCDAVTGQIWATVDDEADRRVVSRKLALSLERLPPIAPLPTAAPPAILRPPTQLPPGTFVVQAKTRVSYSEGHVAVIAESDRYDRIAQIVGLLSDDPTNIDYHFALSHVLSSYFRTPSLHKIIAMLRQYPQTPNGAAWMMATLFSLHEATYHDGDVQPGVRHAREQPQLIRYAPLLETYPGSPEARLVDFAVAFELLDQGRREQALKLLEGLALDLPGFQFPEGCNVNPSAWLMLHYTLAREYYRIGRDDEARRHIAECQARLKDRSSSPPTFELHLRRSDRTARWYISSHNMYSHRQFSEQRIKHWRSIEPQINALARRLQTDANHHADRDYLPSHELLVQAMRLGGAEAAVVHRRALQEHLLEEGDKFAGMTDRVLLQMAAVRLCSVDRTDAQRFLRQFSLDLERQPELASERVRVLWLAGRREEAADILNDQTKLHDAFAQLEAILQLAELNGTFMTPSQQGATLAEYVQKWEQRWLEEVQRASVAFCLLAESLGPRLAELRHGPLARRLLRQALARSDLPPFHRRRMTYHLALVHIFEHDFLRAVELLEQVEHVGVRSADAKPAWTLNTPQDRRAIHAFNRLLPDEQRKLSYQTSLRLAEVRRLGGYLPSAPVDDSPPESVDPSDVYALMLLLGIESDWDTQWHGEDYWLYEAWEGLQQVGPDAAAMLRQVLHARLLDRSQLTDRHVLRALVATRTLLSANDLPPAHELAAWLNHPGVCSVRRYAALNLQLASPSHGAVTTPALTLLSSEKCLGCSHSFDRALIWSSANVSQREWPALAAMLDHPDGPVRANAANLLARAAQFTIPRQLDGQPSDEGIAVVRAWWRQHSHDSAQERQP